MIMLVVMMVKMMVVMIDDCSGGVYGDYDNYEQLVLLLITVVGG